MAESDFSKVHQPPQQRTLLDAHDPKFMYHPTKPSVRVYPKKRMFEIADPAQPRVLRILDLGSGSGPHYLRLSEDERRLVISDYFLNEDSLGKVHAEGDHIVHVARVEHDNLELDPQFEVNFNTAFRTGPARPHGLAFK